MPLVLCLVLAAVPARADVVVPLRTIAAGETLMARDLAVAPGHSADAVDTVERAAGSQALVPLYANRPILQSDLGAAIVLRRNQETVATYDLHGLAISTTVRTLGEAAAGEPVRALNLTSRKIFSGIATQDGTILVLGGSQ